MATLKGSGRRWWWLYVLVLLVGPLAACAPPQAQRPPLKVVATLAPLADWARQVGGDQVEVTQIVPAGIDPLTYTLTEQNRQAIFAADVLLFNGYGIEPWLDQSIGTLQRVPLTTLDLSQYLGTRNTGTHAIVRTPLEGDERGQNGERSELERVYIPPSVVSPYVWLDPGPTMAQRAVVLIADTFTRVNPDNLLIYRRNAERYNGELENLDNWIRQQIRAWPRVRVGSRQLLAIQATDRSWHYFAQHYTINLRTVATLNTFSPTIPAATPLFINRTLSPSEQLPLLGLRKPDGVLDPLSDDSYIELMKKNVNLMTQGMQQAARSEPMQFSSPVNGS